MEDLKTNNTKKCIKMVTVEVDRKDAYKLFLEKLFAGSKLNLTKRDYDILALTKLNMNRFDSVKIAKLLNISSANLNNYKADLIKNKCLVKTNNGYYAVNSTIDLEYGDEIDIVFKLNVVNTPKEVEV